MTSGCIDSNSVSAGKQNNAGRWPGALFDPASVTLLQNLRPKLNRNIKGAWLTHVMFR